MADDFYALFAASVAMSLLSLAFCMIVGGEYSRISARAHMHACHAPSRSAVKRAIEKAAAAAAPLAPVNDDDSSDDDDDAPLLPPARAQPRHGGGSDPINS